MGKLVINRPPFLSKSNCLGVNFDCVRKPINFFLTIPQEIHESFSLWAR